MSQLAFARDRGPGSKSGEGGTGWGGRESSPCAPWPAAPEPLGLVCPALFGRLGANVLTRRVSMR
jgi:hypothetical protein